MINQSATEAEADVKPKLLVITHRVPYPPNRGDKIRNLAYLHQLSRYFEIHLACPSTEKIDLNTYQALREVASEILIEPIRSPVRNTWRCFRALGWLLEGASITEGIFYSKLLHRRIEEQTYKHNYAAVYGVCSSIWPYMKNLKIQTKVVDLMDIDSLKWQAYALNSIQPFRALYHFESRKIRIAELEIAEQCQCVTLTTDHESNQFRQICSEANILTTTNGVNSIEKNDENPYSSVEHHDQPVHMTFIGALDYKPNIQGLQWFTKHVWPVVHEQHPNVIFHIVGRNPDRQTQSMSDLPGVNFVGEVKTVGPYLLNADFIITPLLIARGVQNKVLEGMVAGKLVITSAQAAEGIHATHNENIAVADNEKQWVQLINKAIIDQPWRDKIGSNAQKLVTEHHNWNVTVQPLIETLQDLISTDQQAFKAT